MIAAGVSAVLIGLLVAAPLSLRAAVPPCHVVKAASLMPQDPSARRYQSTAPRVAPSVTADSIARLEYPQGVQERDPTVDRGDAEIVKALEHRLRCTCGCNLDVFTCRTTDFTCATSPAMHRVVLSRLDSAQTPDQVVATFEAQYGQAILMQPPKRGFNWTAYLMPFFGLGLGLALVTALMRRWVARAKAGNGEGGTGKDQTPVPGSTATSHQPPASFAAAVRTDDHVLTPRDAELERLERELERYED